MPNGLKKQPPLPSLKREVPTVLISILVIFITFAFIFSGIIYR